MWIPQLACPECRSSLVEDADAYRCCGCNARFERSTPVLNVLPRRLPSELATFVEQYLRVRRQDGHACLTAHEYRALPEVGRTHPLSGVWRTRQRSFHSFWKGLGLEQGDPCRVLDLGAGNGWLSTRLASHGHQPVAVDICADEQVGLGTARLAGLQFPLVQAHFDALPFAPRQFDIVVLNASLHYAGNPEATLREASRMLAPEGALVVMDSPMFAQPADGEAMVHDHLAGLAQAFRLAEPQRLGAGFLTFAQLQHITDALGLHGRFSVSSDGVTGMVRRVIARYRLRRPPATFGVWIAT